MSIVADHYQFVIGVDTHAATHTYAVIESPSGRHLDSATFPTTPAGLARAEAWIGRRTGGNVGGTLIAAEGTGSYGAVMTERLAQAGYRVTEAPAPPRSRSDGKTDTLDARAAAASTLVMAMGKLRDRRAGQVASALHVLTTAREQMNAERLRAINALTALLRAWDLGIDARKALSEAQIARVAAWRRYRAEPLPQATARTEVIRHAKRVTTLNTDLAANRAQIHTLVTQQAPELLDMPGLGPITAAVILAVWSHPGRIRSEAALAKISGTCPIPASSGNTTRHRLNRGGNRQLNRALHTIALTRMRADQTTRQYVDRRIDEGKTRKEIRRSLKRYISRQIYRTLINLEHTTQHDPKPA